MFQNMIKASKSFEALLVESADRRADAMDEAWELLESQRGDVVESFRGADHATGEQGANFAIMGYMMAMDKLRQEAESIRGEIEMCEHPELTTFVTDRGIELVPNRTFREQSLDLQGKAYLEMWTAIKPLWDKCGRSRKPAEWIPIPDRMTLDQLSVFLDGIRSEIEEMIDDLTIGSAHWSHSQQLMYQWSGGTLRGHANEYEVDIAKLKSRLSS